MRISKKDITKQVESKIFHSFYQTVADITKPQMVEEFFGDILTDTERTILAKRLAIASYLKNNKPYRVIKNELQVSSATISTVQRWLEKGGNGLNRVLENLAADEWAGELADKISAKISSWRRSFT